MTREESDAWLEIYANETEQAKRREQMPGKLEKLGVLNAPKDAKILDLCCGHGETLDTLHALGYTNLYGMDLHLPDEVAADERFTTKAGDATATGLEAESFDWVLCIHSLHHFASAENVEKFVTEAHRVLKPEGRLAVLDFPNSPQIRLAFWGFRQPVLLITPYLKFFGAIIQEEWCFLKHYLPQWPQVRKLLDENPGFELESCHNTLFYYYRTLKKQSA